MYPQEYPNADTLISGVQIFAGRSDITAKTGANPPSYDPNFGAGLNLPKGALKMWAIPGWPTTKDLVANFPAATATGVEVRTITIPGALVPLYNFAGSQSYQSYAAWKAAQPPTKSKHTFDPGLGVAFYWETPLDTSMIFTPGIAAAIVAELGPTAALVPVTVAPPEAIVYDPVDPRRLYDVQGGELADKIALGVVWQARCAGGVGAPGAWKKNTDQGAPAGAVRWVPDLGPQASQTIVAAIPAPMRDLLASEKLVAIGVAEGFAIEDLAAAPAAGASSSGLAGEQFTAIMSALKQLLAK